MDKWQCKNKMGWGDITDFEMDGAVNIFPMKTLA